MNDAEYRAEVERIRAEHDGWVPVECLMPLIKSPFTSSDWLNLTCEGDVVCSGYYSENRGWKDSNNEPRRVIAWQPLPKPYQSKLIKDDCQ